MDPLVRVRRVTKIYQGQGEGVVALRNVSLDVQPGEFLALQGPSGCGKSTLLHILGAMDRASNGEVWFLNRPLHALPEEELTLIRRSQVGFVFQFFYLLPTLTVEENVGLPLLLGGSRGIESDRVMPLLQSVGLWHRRGAMPYQLSGGELQRVALARAVIHRPPLVIADEPTGNLDSENGASVLELLKVLSVERGTAVVMATHSPAAASYATRVLALEDGRLP